LIAGNEPAASTWQPALPMRRVRSFIEGHRLPTTEMQMCDNDASAARPAMAASARFECSPKRPPVSGWISGFIMATAAFFIFAAPITAATQAPNKIDIFGGRLGKVPFLHADHEKRIKDCKVCHDLFPEQADAIKTMKAKGTLKPKKVMNVLCIKCHRQAKVEGKPHGPLTCKKCHHK
jgi:hypothetical protein